MKFLIKNCIFILLIVYINIARSQVAESKFYGTWQLISITRENKFSRRLDDYGRNPIGFLHYSSDGRMMTIIVKEKRKKPAGKITPAEALDLIHSMTSYAGTYTIRGNQIIHHIDVSWNQLWTGKDQIRFYQFVGKYLFLTMSYNDFLNGKTKIILKWEKILS